MNTIADAERRLGFRLRNFQRQAVEALTDGHDVMMSAPTGSGKTAVYQAACWSLRKRGVTLVLSPLIALIRDQHRRMKSANIESACFYSQVSRGQKRYNAELVETDQVDLVLTTPESLQHSTRLREALATVGVALIVVDEGHAYEEWAHSFRPAYRRVGAAIKSIGVERALVCSATMSPFAAAEAAEALDRWDWDVVTAPAARPNLSFVSQPWRSPFDLLRAMANGLSSPGIVYTTAARTANNLHAVASRLASDLPIEIYHGQMRKSDRNDAQERWMNGNRWVFATKAFGMGIDKANVRTVAHVELPASIVDYAQEAGRAGRDGEHAVCVLNRADRGSVAAYLVDQAHPSVNMIAAAYETLKAVCGDKWTQIASSEIARMTGLRQQEAAAARGWLDGSNVIDVRPGAREWAITFNERGVDQMAATVAGRRMIGALDALRKCGRYDDGARMATPDELSEALALHYKDWRGAVQRIANRGAISVVTPRRASWVRVRAGFENFDPTRLERASERAFAKLDAVRRFARLPDSERASAVERAIELDGTDAMDEIKWRKEER